MTQDTAFSGIADRIRCFVSCYIIATENNRNFYIYHDKGFLLQKYLIPNMVDWQIQHNSIAKGLNRATPLWLTIPSPHKTKSNYIAPFSPFRIIHCWPNKLPQTNKEYHAYGILDIISSLPPELQTRYTFKGVFDWLFAPSEYLQKLIIQALDSLQLQEESYIAFHLRFLNFFEPVEPHQTENDVTGTPEQQAQMIDAVHVVIDKVHRSSGINHILLFSDSNRFLQAPHPNYIKILPGIVGHVVRHNEDTTITDKAFTDLFVMSKAQRIYSITGPNIYGSSFAKVAAYIGGREYHTIPLLMSETLSR